MHYRLQTEHWIPIPKDRAFRFFANPDNLPRIMPPNQEARIERLDLVPPSEGSIGTATEILAGTGSQVLLSFRAIPFHAARLMWLAEIKEFVWNQSFSDVQLEGPFREWNHQHEFESVKRNGVEGTLLRDTVEYSPGMGPIGAIADAVLLRHTLRSTFEYRKKAAESLLSAEKGESTTTAGTATGYDQQLRKVGDQLQRLSRRTG